MLVAILVILVLGFATIVALIVGLALTVGRMHEEVHLLLETQGTIMAQIDDLSDILADIGSEVDTTLQHAEQLEAELKTLQEQIDKNQAPDLSMVIEKAKAIRTRLEGVSQAVSQGAGQDPVTTPENTPPAGGEDTPGQVSVGDAAEGDVNPAPAPGAAAVNGDPVGDASQGVGAAPGTDETVGTTTSDQGTDPDIVSAGGATEGNAPNPAEVEAATRNPTADTAPSEAPQETDQSIGDAKAVDASDPEAQARDPNQG